MSLSITESAIRRVRELKTKQNLPEDAALRVGVKGGGCSGLTYVVDMETKPPREGKDQVFVFDGVRVVCDKKSLLYLMNSEIDFTDGFTGVGFTFNNPQAKKTCGCGTSFSL